jgi:SAM-dependent methyltransferase
MTDRIARVIDGWRDTRLEENRAWVSAHGDAAVVALLRRPEHRWRVAAILDHTRSLSGRILEFGSFTGAVSRQIIEQGGKVVVGVDSLEEASRIAREHGVSTILADMDEGIPELASESFDGCVVADLLQHTLDPAYVLGEAYRLMKPGGRLIVTVPNYACAYNRARALVGRTPACADLVGLDGLYPSAFTRDSLCELVSSRGFLVGDVLADVVVFARDGSRASRVLSSRRLARALPSLARNIILVAKRPLES